MGVRGDAMSRRAKRSSLARTLRKKVVPVEALLWKALRNRALAGFKFRRQHPIGP
jgi:very-short-patch-repair endonuclease